MKLKDIIRCVGINPQYVNSDSQRRALDSYYRCNNMYRGGMANAYVYIPYTEEVKALFDDSPQCFADSFNVHGGIDFINIVTKISDYHCPYSAILTDEQYNSKYVLLGWDTNHCDDNPDSWTYKTIIEENERLARQVLKAINDNKNIKH